MFLYLACTSGEDIKDFALSQKQLPQRQDAFPHIDMMESVSHFREVDLTEIFRPEWLDVIVELLTKERTQEEKWNISVFLAIGLHAGLHPTLAAC